MTTHSSKPPSTWARNPVRVGLGVLVAVGVIASGPTVAGALGLTETAPQAAPAPAVVVPTDLAADPPASVVVLNKIAEKQRRAEEKARKKAEAARKKKAAEAAARKKARAEARRAAKAKAARAARRAAARTAGGTPSSNRALGMAMCADAGYSASQCADLGRLWDRESGWNHRVANSSSGAYGIPQSLPGSKMGSVASDWRTNPRTQITWGLKYIKDVYGNPSNAWGHSQRTGWY